MTLAPGGRAAGRPGALWLGHAIAIASDHAAIELKSTLRDWLLEQEHEVADLGPETAESIDYPDFGYNLAAVVAEGPADFGGALCVAGSVSRSRSTATPLAWGYLALAVVIAAANRQGLVQVVRTSLRLQEVSDATGRQGRRNDGGGPR